MLLTFVFGTADYFSALSNLRESADIPAVRYTNLSNIVQEITFSQQPPPPPLKPDWVDIN